MCCICYKIFQSRVQFIYEILQPKIPYLGFNWPQEHWWQLEVFKSFYDKGTILKFAVSKILFLVFIDYMSIGENLD